MIAFLEVALRLQSAQILPLNGRLFLFLDHLMQLQELYEGGHSSATSSMVELDASQLVLRISKQECIV